METGRYAENDAVVPGESGSRGNSEKVYGYEQLIECIWRTGFMT